MSVVVSGTFLFNGIPKNGVSVDAWLASRFGGMPAFGDAPPGGSPDAGPVLSSNSFGTPGAWQLTLPTNAQYYVRVVYQGANYWGLPIPQGPQGLQGLQGLQGFQGPQGPVGPQGGIISFGQGVLTTDPTAVNDNTPTTIMTTGTLQPGTYDFEAASYFQALLNHSGQGRLWIASGTATATFSGNVDDIVYLQSAFDMTAHVTPRVVITVAGTLIFRVQVNVGTSLTYQIAKNDGNTGFLITAYRYEQIA